MPRLATRSKAALITGGMLVAVLAAPAVAAPVPGQAECVKDASGDVRKKIGDSPSGTDPKAAEPRADITRYCVSSGPTASFHVTISRPTDPATDGGWKEATFIGWFIDTDGDGGGDYFIDFSLDATGSAESAQTAEIKDADNDVVCTPAAQLTDTGYAVSGVDASCFGGDSTLEAEVAMYYDNGSEVVYDISDGMSVRDIKADRGVRRLEGGDRTETSVKISQEQFSPGEADTVYLSRSDVFADAAVGGVLTDGPILVVPSCGEAPAVVRSEIDRLNVPTVTALGGTTAICEQMLDSAAEGLDTDRIGGPDRFATSAQVARTAFSSPDRVYLARSDMFIDAVAGGTLTDGPILLVPQCGDVPQVIRDAIADFDPDEVVGLGGTVAICDPTLEQAAGAGRTTSRIAGDDRYGTAIEIAQYVFPEPTAAKVYLARADLVVDALAGGVLTDGPVLVVDSCGDFDEDRLHPVGEEISRNAPGEVVALGGELAICDDTLAQAGAF